MKFSGSLPILALLMLFAVLLQGVFAEELLCQYTVSRQVSEEALGVVVKDTNEFLLKPVINFEDVLGLEQNGLKIKVTNPNNIALSFSFSFPYEVSGDESCAEMGGMFVDEVMNLGAGEASFFEKQLGEGCKVVVFDPLGINYSFLENEVVFAEAKQVALRNVKLCKVCDNGKACLNDGDVCEVNSECGSDYCFDKVCTQAPKCPGGVCACDSVEEVECDGGRVCAKKDALDFGERPVCSSLECKSHFVNSETGLCAKIPDSNSGVLVNLETGQSGSDSLDWLKVSAASNIVIIIIAIIVTAFAVGYFMKRRWVRQAREIKLHYKKESELLEAKSDLRIKELELKEKEELWNVGLASKTDVRNAEAGVKRTQKKLEEIKDEIEHEHWTEKIL